MVRTIANTDKKVDDSRIPMSEYIPSAFILGKEHLADTAKKGVPKGIWMKLPHKKMYAMLELKTRMKCQTWEEFADCLLYFEPTILIDLQNFREQHPLPD